MGIIHVPRFTDLSDHRQKLALQQFMNDLRNKAFNLNMLGEDGAIANGDKAGDFDGAWIVYVSNGSADTEDTVAHELNRIPQIALIGIPDTSAVIYDGTTAWDADNIYLRASAATVTVNIVVF